MIFFVFFVIQRLFHVAFSSITLPIHLKSPPLFNSSKALFFHIHFQIQQIFFKQFVSFTVLFAFSSTLFDRSRLLSLLLCLSRDLPLARSCSLSRGLCLCHHEVILFVSSHYYYQNRNQQDVSLY